jgi:hypothetical protein
VAGIAGAVGLILSFLSVSTANAEIIPVSTGPSYEQSFHLSLAGGTSFGEVNNDFVLPEFYYENHNLFGIQWQLNFLLNLYHLDLSFSTPKVARSKWTLGSGIEARRFEIRDGDLDDNKFEKNGVYEGILLNKKLWVGREIFDRLNIYAEYNGKTYYNDKDSRSTDNYEVPTDFDLHELIASVTYKKLSYDERQDVNYGYNLRAWGSYGIVEREFTYGLPDKERNQGKTIKRFGGSIRLYMMLFGPDTINLFIEGESLNDSIEAFRADRCLAENYITVKLSYSPRIGKKTRLTPYLKVDVTELSETWYNYFGAGFKVNHYLMDKLSLQFSYSYDTNRWGPTVYNATETGEHNIVATIMYRWFN